MAEGVLRAASREAGLDIEVDSAGTGGWHVGNPPYPPAIKAAAARGYDISGQRARQVEAADFERFDLILAMDAANLEDLTAMAPPGAQAQLPALLDYAPGTGADGVPDPYYTGDFEGALDLIEAGVAGVIAACQRAVR